MVLAIFRSLEGENLEDFSIRLAQRWRIGQKTLDNGVVLLVFADDRKVRFEVGYGLEGAVPDAVAGQIIRDTIAPRFREARYATGLEAAIAAVFQRIEATPVAKRQGGQPARGIGISPLTMFVLAGIVLLVVSQLMRRAAPRRGQAYTAGRRGWTTPVIVPPVWWGGGWGRGGGFGGGGGGFSGGGGSFGGGGASGSW